MLIPTHFVLLHLLFIRILHYVLELQNVFILIFSFFFIGNNLLSSKINNNIRRALLPCTLEAGVEEHFNLKFVKITILFFMSSISYPVCVLTFRPLTTNNIAIKINNYVSCTRLHNNKHEIRVLNVHVLVVTDGYWMDVNVLGSKSQTKKTNELRT